MAEAARLICASTELANGGKGVRFEIQTTAGMQAAFVVRYGGSVFGFLNRWNDTLATPLEAHPSDVARRHLAPHGWTPGKHQS